MPVLMTKIEGKGNGIKTVVPNMSDIARALSRPPTCESAPYHHRHKLLKAIDFFFHLTDPTKFFGCELGAQTTFDDKGDRYIVNGAHDATRLRELLDGFIDKFVLCGSCKNPETELVLTKNDEIFRDCKACGQRSGVDMRHKLTTFILKNPPKSLKSKRKGGDAGNAAGGVGSPSEAVHNGSGEGTPERDESDDELTKKIKAEAAELAPIPTEKDEDWSADTSAEAVRARTKDLESGMKNLLLVGGDDSDEDGGDSPYTQLALWAEEHREEATPITVYKKCQELGIEKKHRTVLILVETLFTEHIVKEIPKYAPLFAKVCDTVFVS